MTKKILVILKLDEAAKSPLDAAASIKTKFEYALRDHVKRLEEFDVRMVTYLPQERGRLISHEVALFFSYRPYAKLDLKPLELVNRVLNSASFPQNYFTLSAVHHEPPLSESK